MVSEIRTGLPKGGEGEYRRDLASRIVSEVRECDKRIKDWLIRHGKLEPKDYLKIARPNLVRVRLEILSMLGYVKIEDGIAYPTPLIDNMPIEDLPVNSDTFDRLFKSPLYKLILGIVADYSPNITFLTDIQEILREVAGIDINLRTIHRAMKRLIEYGIVEYDEDSKAYIAKIRIAVGDYEEIARKWFAEYARGSSRLVNNHA